MVFLGKKKSGKSVLILDYLFHNRKVPYVVVISETDMFNKTFEPHVPSRNIYGAYNRDIVQRFVMMQMQATFIKNEQEERYGEGSDRVLDNRGVLIFDDMLAGSKAWRNDEFIGRILMNGRHFGISFLIALQDPMGLQSDWRNNVDYVFICKEAIRSTRKKIFDHYAGAFGSFIDFEAALRKVSKDYGVLVINNSGASMDLDKVIMWYRAELHDKKFNRHGDPWRTCLKSLWKGNSDVLRKKKAELLSGGFGGADDGFKMEKTSSKREQTTKYDNLGPPEYGAIVVAKDSGFEFSDKPHSYRGGDRRIPRQTSYYSRRPPPPREISYRRDYPPHKRDSRRLAHEIEQKHRAAPIRVAASGRHKPPSMTRMLDKSRTRLKEV